MCSRQVPFLSVAPIRGAGPPNPRKVSGGLLGPSKVNLPPFLEGWPNFTQVSLASLNQAYKIVRHPPSVHPQGPGTHSQCQFMVVIFFPDIRSDVLVLTATHESLTTSGTTQNKANCSSTSPSFLHFFFISSFLPPSSHPQALHGIYLHLLAHTPQTHPNLDTPLFKGEAPVTPWDLAILRVGS